MIDLKQHSWSKLGELVNVIQSIGGLYDLRSFRQQAIGLKRLRHDAVRAGAPVT